MNEDTIRNIYCVGRNYRLHAAELGNAVPSSPMLFTKPTHAAAQMTGGDLLLPGGQGAAHFETELVFAVGRPYEAGISYRDIFSHITVGLDLTLRDVQDKLKQNGHPWLAAKGFLRSAPLARWLSYSDALAEADFGLRKNGAEAQRGNSRDMVFGLQELVDFVGRSYGLGKGDLLYTGTPAGVGALSNGDRLEVWLGEETLGSAVVKLE
jgi:fumarylpyruvate hydrolase